MDNKVYSKPVLSLMFAIVGFIAPYYVVWCFTGRLEHGDALGWASVVACIASVVGAVIPYSDY
jgi:hypothetical protein